MAEKWVRKLKDDTASTSASGAQPWKASITSGAPATVNRKQTTTLTTKAITWLLVAAEMPRRWQDRPPAIRKLPT